MNWKKNLKDWLFIVGVWTVASISVTATGIFFQQLILKLLEIDISHVNGPFLEYINSGFQYLEGALFGFLFGTVFFLIYWLSENTRLRNQSFGKIMLIKTGLYTVGFVFVFLTVFLILRFLNISPIKETDKFVLLFLDNQFYIAIASFIILYSIIVNFILEVSKKFGPGNLWDMFTGKYHKPIIEDRIFMFLDLKDSTAYAEKLGHIKYSNLIQRCFLYLNEIVFRHKAQIYQYVGDEAVLTWDSDDPDAARLCMELFFAFREKLESKSEKFEKEFGFVPEFKAGINEGPVTVAEVGYIKREIAYHGDVLNTGARIQSMCNQFGKSLLVSELFANQTKNFSKIKQELMGEILLKGKQQAVNIYAIDSLA
ncbi:MAG: adenylate/guanylate cyclase domain-containing protein [Reichenbachiella sp.]|uniref:adenylate/guanylate cyclase domain-containing protein n=1 Tax=Reichenbachiella sp. TaxID=2184521 RepID=UPI0032676516